MRSMFRLLPVLLLLAASPLQAVTYTVNHPGSGNDSNTADNICSTATPANQTTCTLHAAIQEANSDASPPHMIKFASAVTKVTLTASLPQTLLAITFDGTTTNAASGGRVEIDGGVTNGCFLLNANGATVKNFVIRRCSGAGISASGHNFKLTGNRIGTNPGADSGSSASDANSGDGISLSGTIAVAPSLPALSAQLATLPQSYAGVLALSEALKTALTVVAQPNVISGNVISGNTENGIDLFGQGTVNNIVTGNIIGLSQDGLSAIPNGRGPGGASNKAGIHLSGTAYGNFIGPANIVSGNLGHGIAIDSGSVQLPNFIAGNLIGLGSAPVANVGNAENGIYIDSVPNGPNHGGLDNPTGLSAIIGPANTISDNKSEPNSSNLDVENGDTAGGLLISGNATKIKVFANVVGLATFPAGATPLGQLQYGNVGNGMVITGSNNEILNNLVLANGRHGLLLRGGTGNVIRGNYIGVSVPTGLAPFVNLGNTGDGIHIAGASSSFIGGTGANDANFIAANGRHGIAMRVISDAWANLVTRNRIYGNAKSGTGIAIDLDQTLNGPDVTDFPDNPGATSYANRNQHRPVICSGGAEPAACAGADAPLADGDSGTEVQWTITTRPNASNTIRVEFFANAADGSDQKYLGDKLISTDASGLPTGGGCANGLCTTSVGGSGAGMNIVATATDLTLADVPPTSDQPPVPDTASNNTSEFSDVATATPKLEITTQPPLPPGDTNVVYPGVTFAATGGSGSYVDWTVSNGNLPNGLTLAASTGVLSGTPTVANTFNFTVRVTDSIGAQATAAYAITVTAAPPLTITTASPLPNGTAGSVYPGVTFGASGGNGAAGNWQLQNGELPTGLSLSAAGVLGGTPTEVGTFDFNVRTTDQQPTTVVKAFSLTIAPAPVPLAITTASPLPNGRATLTYTTQIFAATGGSGIYVAWAVSAGALPGGLLLDPDSGQLSGKPTTAGAYNFTVRVTDDDGAIATKAFALTIDTAPPPPPVEPEFTATPSELDFGDVTVGRTGIAEVRLTNRSSTNATYTPRLTQPPADSGFTVDYGDCDDAGGTPQPLAPNEFCTMMVAFTPTAGGETPFSSSSRVCRSALFNGQCLIFIGQPTTVLARLTYRGTGTGTLAQVTPTSIDFGSQTVGSTTDVTVTVTNPTGVNVNYFGSLPLLFSNANGFSLASNSCGFGIVAPTTPCELTFRFSPPVPGAAESSTRVTLVQSGSAITEAYDIELRGTGVPAGDPIRPSPVALDFGMVNVGDTVLIPVVTTNLTAAPITITAAPFNPDETVWGRFTFFGCANPIDPSSETCSWIYGFSPKARGDFTASSEIISTDASSQTFAVPISLRGTGVGSLVEVSPKQLDFGQVNLGDVGRGKVTITNTGADTLTLTFSGVFPFVFSDTCAATLAPDASCTINYSLSGDGDPLGPVQSQATLLFESSGNSESVMIDLSANLINVMFRDGFE